MKKFLSLLLASVLIVPAFAQVPNKVINEENNSTVLIKVKFKQTVLDDGAKELKSGWGVCSGVYIDKNVILSANHCVDLSAENAVITQLWVKKGDRSETAIVLKTDKDLDLSLLYTTMDGLPVSLASSAKQGEDIFVLGNPLGINSTITQGIISKDNFKLKKHSATYFVVDAVALPGNSGGSVLDNSGHLVGILVMSTSMLGVLGASGLGLVVSLKDLKDFLGK